MSTPGDRSITSGDWVRHPAHPDALLVLPVPGGLATSLRLAGGGLAHLPAGELLPLPSGQPADAVDSTPV